MNRRNFLLAAGSSLASPLALSWAQPNAATGPNTPLLFGVDYYPDQTPESLWQQDTLAMAATGVTNVRIAEFAWALMEPEEGKFDFSWLRRAVNLLHSHGIAVILGTPSAAPPPWLTQKISGGIDGQRAWHDAQARRASLYLSYEQDLSTLGAHHRQ